jgi:predicted DNA-binding protein (UPF0251 family)
MPRYRAIKNTPIRRHLMPARPNEIVTCGVLVEGEEFEGEPLMDYVQIQDPHRSGFVGKRVVEVIEPPASS